MSDKHEMLILAAEYLVLKGMLSYHEKYHVYYGGGSELDKDFWESATSDKKRGKKGPIPWASSMSQEEFTDLLSESYKRHSGSLKDVIPKDRDD